MFHGPTFPDEGDPTTEADVIGTGLARDPETVAGQGTGEGARNDEAAMYDNVFHQQDSGKQRPTRS